MSDVPGRDAPGGWGPVAAAERAVRRGLIGLVKAYRLLLSPVLGSSCRFTPTCSVYALQALERHGAGRGSYLTLSRLARCHPWCQGGVDEVPGVPDTAAGADQGRRGTHGNLGGALRGDADATTGRGTGGLAGGDKRLFSGLLSSSSQKKNP